jgi:hypothetical protein
MHDNRKRKSPQENVIPPSMFSYNPPEEMTIKVADFLKYMIQKAVQQKEEMLRSGSVESIQIEIEAKLGIVCSKETRSRIELPILSETSISI